MNKPASADLDPKESIVVKGARQHNLKNIDVVFPKNKLIVVTGVSGSGKSSLTMDTLYAEGQRRYVESLSAYARQFLDRMNKPDIDYIKGICPAIALEQKVNVKNSRSTVGTVSEIYDYLRLLYARIGRTYSPISGKEVKRDTYNDVVTYVHQYKEGQKVQLFFPLQLKDNSQLADTLELLLQKGFNRIAFKGQLHRIEDLLEEEKKLKKWQSGQVLVLVDRFVVRHDSEENKTRISDSVQTAFFEGKGQCIVEVIDIETKTFSNAFTMDGMEFEEPNAHLFNFNSPYGACRECDGFGTIMGIEEERVVPDKELSVYEGAIACWRGQKMKRWKERLIKEADKFDFPIHRPYKDLTKKQKQLLWDGNEHFKGLNTFFNYLERKSYKIQYRVMLSRYRGKTICPVCKGSRLRKETEYVRVDGKPIGEILQLPIVKVARFFENISLTSYEQQVTKRILTEICQRLHFLLEVGLDYLTLQRDSRTLSGGETQRINLAKFLGSHLISSIYILDEPSVGLHPRDTERLLNVLESLRDLGNTVVVVEHDEATIKKADHVIDMGPEAGEQGGEVVFEGNYQQLMSDKESLTGAYLQGEKSIDIPQVRRKWSNSVMVLGATQHNLKDIDVQFPLEVLNVVTGVSGSGKTTLVKQILYRALQRKLQHKGDKPGEFDRLVGDIPLLDHIELVDQKPIGTSSRSNPVTYVKAYDAIRKLFARQKLAQLRGYKPKHFSFNVEGGRCDECKGEGEIVVEMQFMADVHLICEVCKGKRFKKSVLDVTYKEKNISDVLNMTINEALQFFSEEKEVIRRLKPLQDVGLGYIRLGQSSNTLSGGEAQRVKLASFLSERYRKGKTLFIFDEPTTGLHFHDIRKLLNSFDALIEQGHSVIVIEHNLEIIKYADWVIDLGPGGGEEGGDVIFTGPPEELVQCKDSYTGHYLQEKMPVEKSHQ